MPKKAAKPALATIASQPVQHHIQSIRLEIEHAQALITTTIHAVEEAPASSVEATLLRSRILLDAICDRLVEIEEGKAQMAGGAA